MSLFVDEVRAAAGEAEHAPIERAVDVGAVTEACAPGLLHIRNDVWNTKTSFQPVATKVVNPSLSGTRNLWILLKIWKIDVDAAQDSGDIQATRHGTLADITSNTSKVPYISSNEFQSRHDSSWQGTRTVSIAMAIGQHAPPKCEWVFNIDTRTVGDFE